MINDNYVKLVDGDMLLYKGDSLQPVFEKLGIEAEEIMRKVRR